MYEPQRPLIHFAPGRNWMNDPNGCVFFNGSYHLYYQYHPHGNQWGPMHWGHAVSENLVEWEEKGIALYPDDETGMAFSGSAVVDTGNVSGFFPEGEGLLAYYTGHIPGSSEDEYLQHQCMAHSPDGGETWIPFKGNPVVTNPGLKDFRDPKVFRHESSGAWVMVVVAGREVRFYRSEDLVIWSFSGRFGEGYGLAEGLWECPDLFSLPDPRSPGKTVWILTVSVLGRNLPEFSPVQYFIGDFDGYEFLCAASPEAVLLADRGHDFYAAQSWFGLEAQERTVWIAWANHWAYANDIPAGDWRGVMSLPRELALVERGGGLCLKQTPVRELETLLSDAPLPDDAPADGVHDIFLRFADAASGDVDVVFSFANGGEMAVRWEAAGGRLSVDRTRVSRGGFHPEFHLCPSTILDLSAGNVLDVRIILDRSLVEVFALEGTVTFTSQIFPGARISGIRIRGGGVAGLAETRHRVLDRNNGK